MAENGIQVAPSALTQFLEAHQPNEQSQDPVKIHQYNLALQVLHNLRYQHRWTDLETHNQLSDASLPRPLISGVPPVRLYVHPEEQIEIIKAERERARKRDSAGTHASESKDEEVRPEPEWVLPTHIQEEWSLEKFAQIFDVVEAVPPGYDAIRVDMKWRSAKRLLLAILQDDSTIVYYIIHDGIAKPRQN